MTTNHGGARSGAGRPASENPAIIRLSKTAQQELNIIFVAVRSLRSEKFSKAKLVEELIHKAWLTYDAQWQANGEELAEVEVTGNAIIL